MRARVPLLAAILVCGCEDEPRQLFVAEIFEPPPPAIDVPCSEASPWMEVAVPVERGLADIFGSGTSMWIAGGQGTVLSYDGAFTDRSVQDFSGDLLAIHGTGDDDVWVVGREGYAARWDGSAWTRIDTGTTKVLTDVWATARDEVWLIGEEGVRRFDGRAIRRETGWPDGPMNALWASGSSDVRIVANRETFQWDGARWTTITVERSGRLTAVWGKGADRVWALGHNDAEAPGFAMFDDDRWLFGAAPRRAFFFSLWGREPDGLWAGASETSIYYWDEAKWCREHIGNVGAITAFFGTSHSDVWAAGSISGAGGETRPILLRRR